MKATDHTPISAWLQSIAFFAVVSAYSKAWGQWSVTILAPSVSTGSQARGCTPGAQVGDVVLSSGGRAALWHGDPVWIDLTPSGALEAMALATSGNQQVGRASFVTGNHPHASLWTGSAASWIDLHPSNASHSYALGVNGGRQVGYVSINGNARASLWSGSVSSWIDLTPTTAVNALVYGIDGNKQVGWTSFPGGQARASLWFGSAASRVDLHPAGAILSTARAVNGNQQVGECDGRASLWTGSSASWINLAPSGASSSIAHGVVQGIQVGTSSFGGIPKASLWMGTASSWVDLHSFLPVGFTSSFALAIARDGGDLYVSGYATRAGRQEAILWIRLCLPTILAPPPSMTICGGVTAIIPVVTGVNGPFTFQWQLQGLSATAPTSWSDVPDGPLISDGHLIGTLTGTTTNELRYTVGGSLTKPYRCVVTNSCSSKTTESGFLSTCPAEVLCDGGVDINDLLHFLASFAAGTAVSDLDNGSGTGVPDGGVDINDLLFFLARFEAGC